MDCPGLNRLRHCLVKVCSCTTCLRTLKKVAYNTDSWAQTPHPESQPPESGPGISAVSPHPHVILRCVVPKLKWICGNDSLAGLIQLLGSFCDKWGRNPTGQCGTRWAESGGAVRPAGGAEREGERGRELSLGVSQRVLGRSLPPGGQSEWLGRKDLGLGARGGSGGKKLHSTCACGGAIAKTGRI